ncbi:MAG: c-type cytochrome domain-containing protein [Prosthecobacter sp.]
MIKPASFLLALVLALSANAADDKKAADPAVAAAMQKVNATGASLMPVAADAKTFRFTALNVAKEFTDAGLDAIAPIADKLSSLDLARTKITDAGLAKVAAMKNLQELHLENTAISDAGLDHLKGLASLEYLNLYNTKVTDAGIAKLAGLGKLKALYVWQSGVTKAGVAALKTKLPLAHINNGWTAEDDAKPVAVVAAAKPAPASKPAAAAKPATAAKPAAAAKLDPAIAAKAVIYRDLIAPIMQAKCVSCHGEEKKKGKLQLHNFAAMMLGGSDGETTVIPKNTKDSLLLVRANLPTDDDDHMPPSDEPQLTKEELAILKWWIETGASDSVTVAAAKPSADVEGALATILAKGLPKVAAPAKEEKPKPQPLTEAEKKLVAEITKKMQELNASLMPLAQDTEQLRLGVINAADKFGDKELALLAPIAKHVVWVDLARSTITDAAADTLVKMVNLERLHLENTKFSDAGLAKLGALQKLEYLNLYGDKVTDAGISKMAAAKALKKLFVWQTGVTQNGAKALEGKLPGLKVNVGLSEAEIAKLTAPPPAPPPAPAKKEEPKKADPKAAAAKPAAGNTEVIKTAMKKYHKPDDAICKTVSAGKGSDADLATLLKVYQEMCAAMPPKGEKAAWVKKCQNVIGALKKIQAKDAAGVAAFKEAVNCKACHADHKKS